MTFPLAFPCIHCVPTAVHCGRTAPSSCHMTESDSTDFLNSVYTIYTPHTTSVNLRLINQDHFKVRVDTWVRRCRWCWQMEDTRWKNMSSSVSVVLWTSSSWLFVFRLVVQDASRILREPCRYIILRPANAHCFQSKVWQTDVGVTVHVVYRHAALMNLGLNSSNKV